MIAFSRTAVTVHESSLRVVEIGVREPAGDRAATVRRIYGAGVNLIDVGSLVRGAPPLYSPRDNLDLSRGYFMRYVNSRGFTTGEKTAGS